MAELAEVATAFVRIAHRIVWCSVATVDRRGRPRSRVLHPIWEWDGRALVGWVGTSPTPLKRAHLGEGAFASCSYWDATQEAAVAECRSRLEFDDAVRTRVWHLFRDTAPPLGYDPGAIGVPGWDSPTAPGFVVMRLDPWRLRVITAEAYAASGSGAPLRWSDSS